jgi:hypothetical protein
MKPPVLSVDDARDPAAEQVIAEGLRRYNREQCGISDGLFIDLFFLPEELRRGGVGSRLLQLAEDEGAGAAARRRSSTRSASRRPVSTSATGTASSGPFRAIRRAPAVSSRRRRSGDAVTAMAPLPVEAHEITVSQR